MDGENKSGMQCIECEALLAEAMDGSLHGATLAAFEAHQNRCPGCHLMLEEAKVGMHWLKALDEAEPPRNLVHNILAQTIGLLPSENGVMLPQREGWFAHLKERLAPVFSPVVTPRFAMSFGMAFFSITLLLSIAGFHFSDLRHVDLSSKGITKAYYSTEARVIRYYENIRLVYEIESRVRDLRRVATPPESKPEETKPKNPPPKSDLQQEKEHRNQNYHLDGSQPVLAAFPEGGDGPIMNQARLRGPQQAPVLCLLGCLNRRTA
jgi:hypothetical protein